MAHGVQRPHDKLFRTVFADPAEAAALLRAHLPESLARDLRWSTLTLQDRSFVDPDLRDTESDLLFSIRRKAGAPPAWLYVLVEHQSRPDRWIRFRLLKYCCRIWDRSRRQFPRERRLRPIVPLVFYQGPGRWRHATEFADSVRHWPWVSRFAHLLVDQSRENPQAVRGRLHGRVRQPGRQRKPQELCASERDQADYDRRSARRRREEVSRKSRERCHSGGHEMKAGSRYIKIVEWSEEDQCYVGSCPGLFYAGCHGNDEKQVFAELCEIVDETVELYIQDGKPLPEPTCGRDYANKMLLIV